MKALLIDAAAREVREVELCEGETFALRDMQRLVGGPIEIAWRFRDENVLFVDEEGMFKPQEHFFLIADRGDHPLAGNGLVVGREQYDATTGDYAGTDDVALTIEELTAQIRFVDRAYVDAWAKANASEPSATFTYYDAEGKPHTEVLSTFGRLIGDMPPSKKENEN